MLSDGDHVDVASEVEDKLLEWVVLYIGIWLALYILKIFKYYLEANLSNLFPINISSHTLVQNIGGYSFGQIVLYLWIWMENFDKFIVIMLHGEILVSSCSHWIWQYFLTKFGNISPPKLYANYTLLIMVWLFSWWLFAYRPGPL